MIMPARPAQESYTHTLSDSFIHTIKKSVMMVRNKDDGWKQVMRDALSAEFLADAEMHKFALEHYSDIVGLTLQGYDAIYIHRSLSHGLELFTDD